VKPGQILSSIEAEDNLIPCLEIGVKNGTLDISQRPAK
jgi:hypothetical protein